jgi:hypothetical protein
VCLGRSEFPPSADCPINGLSCGRLDVAAGVVRRYLYDEDFFEAQEVLEACLDEIIVRHSDVCTGGQGGAGGEEER